MPAKTPYLGDMVDKVGLSTYCFCEMWITFEQFEHFV